MTREYIIYHTPAQIAAENTADEIRIELESLPFTIDEAADLFGGNDPAERADEALPDVEWCEQLLVEWYDEREAERPCTAEELALTFHLYSAWYINQDAE